MKKIEKEKQGKMSRYLVQNLMYGTSEVKYVLILETALTILRKLFSLYILQSMVFKKLFDIKIGREQNKCSFNSINNLWDQEGILKELIEKWLIVY